MSQDNKRLKTVSKIMEKFWLALAIFTLVAVIVVFINDRGINKENAQYLVFPALAGVMYAFRKSFRKRLEKSENQ